MNKNVKKIILIWGVATVVIGATLVFAASGKQKTDLTKEDSRSAASPIDLILGVSASPAAKNFDNTPHPSTVKQSVGLSAVMLDIQPERAGIGNQEFPSDLISELEMLSQGIALAATGNNSANRIGEVLSHNSPLYLIGLGGKYQN